MRAMRAWAAILAIVAIIGHVCAAAADSSSLSHHSSWLPALTSLSSSSPSHLAALRANASDAIAEQIEINLNQIIQVRDPPNVPALTDFLSSVYSLFLLSPSLFPLSEARADTLLRANNKLAYIVLIADKDGNTDKQIDKLKQLRSTWLSYSASPSSSRSLDVQLAYRCFVLVSALNRSPFPLFSKVELISLDHMRYSFWYSAVLRASELLLVRPQVHERLGQFIQPQFYEDNFYVFDEFLNYIYYGVSYITNSSATRHDAAMKHHINTVLRGIIDKSEQHRKELFMEYANYSLTEPELQKFIKPPVLPPLVANKRSQLVFSSPPRVIRVGVISQFMFRQHSVYRTLYRYLLTLKNYRPNDNYFVKHGHHRYNHTNVHYNANIRYDIDLLQLGPLTSDYNRYLWSAIHIFDHASDLQRATDILSHCHKNEYDVLYYPSVGMSWTTVYLSNIRLAAIQIASQGHSISSWGTAIDYFVSGDEVELIKIQPRNYLDSPYMNSDQDFEMKKWGQENKRTRKASGGGDDEGEEGGEAEEEESEEEEEEEEEDDEAEGEGEDEDGDALPADYDPATDPDYLHGFGPLRELSALPLRYREAFTENYSETLLLLPGMGVVHNRPAFTRVPAPPRPQAAFAFTGQSGPAPGNEKAGERIIFNCPWTPQKLNYPFIKALAHAINKAETHYRTLYSSPSSPSPSPSPVVLEFRLFAFLGSGLKRAVLAQEIQAALLKAQHHYRYTPLNSLQYLSIEFYVYGELAYDDYMAALSEGTVMLESSHYGSCNTVVDSLALDIPVIVNEGLMWNNRIGAKILSKRLLHREAARDDDGGGNNDNGPRGRDRVSDLSLAGAEAVEWLMARQTTAAANGEFVAKLVAFITDEAAIRTTLRSLRHATNSSHSFYNLSAFLDDDNELEAHYFPVMMNYLVHNHHHIQALQAHRNRVDEKRNRIIFLREELRLSQAAGSASFQTNIQWASIADKANRIKYGNGKKEKKDKGKGQKKDNKPKNKRPPPPSSPSKPKAKAQPQSQPQSQPQPSRTTSKTQRQQPKNDEL